MVSLPTLPLLPLLPLAAPALALNPFPFPHLSCRRCSPEWDNSTCNYLPRGAVGDADAYPDCHENSGFWLSFGTPRVSHVALRLHVKALLK